MTASPERIQELFLKVVVLPSDERAAALDRECGTELELRRRVSALLAAHDDPESYLEGTAPALAATIDVKPDVTFTEGTVIAERYTLRQKIGEGGMGEVWVAKQSEPVKRRVALKVIKRGMDSRAVLGRFEQERQALALMDHPNIARVLDGGITSTGQPFFVMELVNGQPLDKYCDAAKLTLRQRLELFVPISQAVHHAHQKGIVHRDLKPANILVTIVDGRPMPKVIDFGLAKAVCGNLSEETMTGFGAVVGTLEYMSPEQAAFSNVDVDTRADIYSLGVILYELLTGLRPIDHARLKQAALMEMIRIIREEEPSKPSTRLSAEASLQSVAAVRNTVPHRLMATLRGELDWVVMKCLAKDREQRYASATDLVRDLERYLEFRPVEARPPSVGYRLRKFLIRNKGATAAACLLLLTLLLGIAGTTWGLVQARRQQRVTALRAEGERIAKLEAERKRGEADRQRIRAEANGKLAEERLVLVAAEKQKVEHEQRIAQSVRDFLQNKLLGQASAFNQADALLEAGQRLGAVKWNPTIRELLDRAAREISADKLDENFPEQYRLQAEILETVAVTYSGTGDFKKAAGLLERALALRKRHFNGDDSSIRSTMNTLAAAYLGGGRLDQARTLFERTLELQKKYRGDDHPHTVTTMSNLAGVYLKSGQFGLAVTLLEKLLLKIESAGGDSHDAQTVRTLNNLGLAYHATGHLDKALPLLERALETQERSLGSVHPQTNLQRENLAVLYKDVGQFKRALPLFERNLLLRTQQLGSDHPQTLGTLSNLGLLYQELGDLDRAWPLFEKSLKGLEAKLGADHPLTLGVLNNLASNHQEAGRMDKALPLLEESLRRTEAKLGPQHPQTLTCMHNLASAQMILEEFDKALPLFEATLQVKKQMLGLHHPHTQKTIATLAQAYFAAKQFDKSVPLFAEAYKHILATHGDDPLRVMQAQINLADAYRASGAIDKAWPLSAQVLEQRQKRFGVAHPSTLSSFATYVEDARAAGQLSQALPQLEKLLDRLIEKQGGIDVSGLFCMNLLGPVYLEVGQFATAQSLLTRTLQIQQKSFGSDDDVTLATMATLGLTLIKTGAHSKSEATLRECLALCQKQKLEPWFRFRVQALLGRSLLEQKKYDDALPLLREGYQGLNKHEQDLTSYCSAELLGAVHSLVRVYEALGNVEAADKWRNELKRRQSQGSGSGPVKP